MKNLICSGVAAGLAVISGVAAAADLPAKAPPAPAVIPTYNWTGFYIGGNAGDAIGRGEFTDNLAGGGLGFGQWADFIGGGQIGYNYQVGSIVLGVEATLDGATGNSGTWRGFIGGDVFQARSEGDWISTVTGRIGISSPFADHWLLYAKGGGGWAAINNTVADLTTGLAASTSSTHSGWLVGAGVEWAFASNWTIKIEYDYLALQSYSMISPFTPGDTFNVSNNSIQTVVFGINYLFNWGGSVAN